MANKVITKVLTVSDKTKEMMIDFFDEYKRDKTPPYAILQADDGGTVVHVRVLLDECRLQQIVVDPLLADALVQRVWIDEEQLHQTGILQIRFPQSNFISPISPTAPHN